MPSKTVRTVDGWIGVCDRAAAMVNGLVLSTTTFSPSLKKVIRMILANAVILMTSAPIYEIENRCRLYCKG